MHGIPFARALAPTLGIVALLGALLVAPGCVAATTTVVLVRHAEREAIGSDPALTPAGQQRAQELIGVVDQAGISTIYVTEFLRTQQTAAPAATQFGLTPVVFPVNSNPQQHAQSLASTILSGNGGKQVLVVGHSDTVPLLIEALGVTPAPAIGNLEFGRIFVVVKTQNQPARLIESRYGQ